jgi:glutamyl-tRNA synthetase
MVCPIVDSIEGVTHAMRSNVYHDRNEQYQILQMDMKLRPVKICDYAHLNFETYQMPKRKLRWFVQNHKAEGWDDVRLPTVRGMLRRGLTKEALWEFILDQGFSKNTKSLPDIHKLWAINKRLIDPHIRRYWALAKKDMVKVNLAGAPEFGQDAIKPFHKKNPSLGNKMIWYLNQIYIEQTDATRLEPEEEVTLMDWGNAIINKVHGEDVVTHIDATLNLSGDYKRTTNKLTWLAVTPENLIEVKLVDFGNYTVDDTQVTLCLGDANLKHVQKGDKIQLERRGYYICDEVILCPEHQVVLYRIPDGHNQSPAIVMK